jgi:putative peptidoglycan lipid II flippase
MQLAFGVFAIAIATASFPTMSEQASRGEWKKFKETWRFSFRLTLFITVPAALGLAAIALPIVSVLYLHGKFSFADVTMTAHTAMAFAPGLLAMATVRNVVQTFYALEDTKTPVKVAAVILFINLALGLFLIRYQVVGLALSLSLSTSIQAVILLFLLKKKIGALGLASILKAFMGHLVLAGIAVGAAYGVTQWGDWESGFGLTNLLILGSAIASAALIYGGASLAFKQQEALTVAARFRRKR